MDRHPLPVQCGATPELAQDLPALALPYNASLSFSKVLGAKADRPWAKPKGCRYSERDLVARARFPPPPRRGDPLPPRPTRGAEQPLREQPGDASAFCFHPPTFPCDAQHLTRCDKARLPCVRAQPVRVRARSFVLPLWGETEPSPDPSLPCLLPASQQPSQPSEPASLACVTDRPPLGGAPSPASAGWGDS